MPVYEYECCHCHNRFEVRQSFSENGGSSCPKCDKKARRVFSPVPIIFKGSGFYVTDHRAPQKDESVTESAKEDSAVDKKDNGAECKD